MQKAKWGAQAISGPRHDIREKLMMGALRSLATLKEDGRFLEAGCGSATFSQKLIGEYPDMRGMGFDNGKGYESQINARFGDDERFEFFPADFEDLPPSIRDCRFDLVIAAEVLEHLDDDVGAVRSLSGLLNTGGTLLVTVPHRMDYWNKEDEWAGHRRRYDRVGLKDLVESAGLDIISLRDWGYPITRAYTKHIVERMIGRDAGFPKRGLISSAASYAAYLAMHADLLMMDSGAGIGLILAAKKPAD